MLKTNEKIKQKMFTFQNNIPKIQNQIQIQTFFKKREQMLPKNPNKHLSDKATSPTALLTKLSSIKVSGEASSKKIKQLRQLQQKISFYEDYCTSTNKKMENKLLSLKNQVDEVKKEFYNIQNIGVLKFDQLQAMLSKTLDSYEQDIKKGESMINELVRQTQDQLQKSIIQKSMESSQLVEQYLKLNNRLQSILQSINSMQMQVMGKYRKLRNQLNKKFIRLQNQVIGQVEQSERNAEKLLKRLEKIQEDCVSQIHRIDEKREKKRYHLHQIIQKMIKDAVQQDQD